MSVLAVPDAGLQLESSDSSDALPMQAFGITLNSSVIEDMIQCVQNGQKLELFLGNNPSLQYGDEEELLKPTPDSFDYDLYLANLNDSSTKAQRLPNPTTSILKKPTNTKGSKPSIRVDKAKGSSKVTKTKPLPPGRSAMSVALSGTGATKSLPSSPSLKGVGSPSHNPAFAATQQLMEKNKEQRATLVHELAVGDQSYEHLKEKWSGSEADLKTTLGRVADQVGGKWSMKKLFWKELDVWNYDYNPSSNRQLAIDNARRQYDKQRLGATEPEWERLLEEKDRGKGIVLSKLQATLAKGNITPATKPPKPDDTSGKNSSDESVKSRTGGEAMARSSSQPVGSKAKAKASDREPQTKKLLSNKPAATTRKAAPVTKRAAPPAKAKAPAADKGGKKFLSEEYVQDTSSEDEAPLAVKSSSKPKPVERADKSPMAKSIERLNEKPAEKPKERSPAPAAVKAKPKSVIRAPRPAGSINVTKAPVSTVQKRSREDGDSSSSSGAPLSKRVKPKDVVPAVKPVLNTAKPKHRPSDASQNSRGTPSNVSNKSKNTSPAKSSPLASSPPTNASDLDENSVSGHSQQTDRQRQSSTAPRTNGHTGTTNGNVPNGVPTAKKRLPESRSHTPTQPPAKKARVNKVSEDILEKAVFFDVAYDRYKHFHEKLTQAENPSHEDLIKLTKMRGRLVEMKAEIRQAVETS